MILLEPVNIKINYKILEKFVFSKETFLLCKNRFCLFCSFRGLEGAVSPSHQNGLVRFGATHCSRLHLDGKLQVLKLIVLDESEMFHSVQSQTLLVLVGQKEDD